MKRNSSWCFLQLLAGLALALIAHSVSAQVLNNGRLRFGDGAENSVNAQGNLQQPFYYDPALTTWFPLTFSDYPLDNAIAIGGDGANEWNISGVITDVYAGGVITNPAVDASAFTPVTGNIGYGTLVSSATATLSGQTLEIRNTYELGVDKSFVKITTRLTNTSVTPVTNVRVWVGTRDDFVGETDQPNKLRGNLDGDGFTAIDNAATRAAALQITSGEQGVLFYSTSPKAYTTINNCCQFSRAYNQNPATAQITRTNDGSYALFVRMEDLAVGASEEFTWYYAAGAIDDLTTIIDDLAGEVAGINVTASAGAGGTITPANVSVISGATAQFTVTPSAGYRIDTVTGCDGSLNVGTYTTGAITTTCNVSATFTLLTYEVTASAGEGGSISPATATVAQGETTAFAVTPTAGYNIDSVSGCGGSLVGTTFTTAAVSGACAVSATFALAPPTFSAPPQTVFEVNSTELLTTLPSSATLTAVDFQGTVVMASLLNGQPRYAPGVYTLIWRAVDSRGVEGTFEQIVWVRPTVNFGPDLSIGARAGNFDSFRIALNGRSPDPLNVTYTVSGDTQGTTLESGVVQFAVGEVEKQIPFAVTTTQAAGTPERTVQVSLDEQLNRGSARSLTITLTTVNQAPRVNLQIAQSGEERRIVARDSGPVTFGVDVQDPDTTDTHTVEWRAPPGVTFTVNGDSIVVDPSTLAVGVHRFEVVVTDNGAPPVVTRRTFDVAVVAATPVLPGGATRLLPNGLPDSPAYAPVAPNVLPERGGELSHHLMEADAGTRLSLGPYAMVRGDYQTEIEGASGAVQIPDDTIANLGGYFDFVVDDLPRVGDSVSVVIPQRAPIPINPVYRKYDPVLNSWRTFVEDGDNRLASALGADGFCPPTLSSEYRSGLNSGDWCVRLTIKDGSVNDADGAVNGSVSDPGGVGSLSNVTVTGKSGGGSFDVFVLIGALFLLLLKLGHQRKGLAALALLSMAGAATQASADDRGPWYIGGQFGSAHTNVNRGEIEAALRAQGYAVTTDVSDRSREAWRVYGGYQWTEVLGIEAGYIDLGEVKLGFTGPIADVGQFLVDANALQPPSAEGFDLSAVARFALGSMVSVHARAGAFYWDAHYRTRNIDGQSVSRKDHDLDGVAGVGVQLNLFEQWSVGAEVARYGIDGDHIDFGGVDITFRW